MNFLGLRATVPLETIDIAAGVTHRTQSLKLGLACENQNRGSLGAPQFCHWSGSQVSLLIVPD